MKNTSGWDQVGKKQENKRTKITYPSNSAGNSVS
jgi:hypothetical protein